MRERIALIAAMPEEIHPLIKAAGRIHREKLGGFTLYHFDTGGVKVALIESGIGAANAAKAARTLIDATSPDILINFGFGGAALPGPIAGDIVVADRILFFKERLFNEQSAPAPDLTTRLASALEDNCGGEFRIHQGTFITTGEIIGKGAIARLLPSGTVNPVLEMETAAVARIAGERKVPFTAVRGISDGADEELDFSIADFTDREMRIRVWKVLWTLARKPRLVPQLMRLQKNSRLAGENLATAILAIIEELAKG